MKNNEELFPLEPKIPIKNLHTVRCIKIYNNQEILVIFDSLIHFHSISAMTSGLPSLVYVIQLSQIAEKVDHQHYQDEITRKIMQSNKSEFGEIIFGKQLDANKNALLSITNFKDRLKFLSNAYLKVKNVHIHQYGHLLINFQDRRSILIQRNLNFQNGIQYNKLYNLTEAILFNNITKSQIFDSVFISNHNLSIICLSSQKNKQQKIFTKLQLNSQNKQFECFNSSNRIQGIYQKGLIQMSYTYGKDQNGWVSLLYYNRLQIIQISKNNQKNKIFQIQGHLSADFGEQLSNQYLMNSWIYPQHNPNPLLKTIKIYLLTRLTIWQLQITFKLQKQQKITWTYTIQKIDDKLSAQSHIYYINYKGNYLSWTPNNQTHHNFMLNLAVETDSGILVKIQASQNNYKQGTLVLLCQSRDYMVGKMMAQIQAKQRGDRNWVNFRDLNFIKKYKNLKKDILVLLTEANSQKDPKMEILVINILTILESKIQHVEKLRLKSIKAHLKLKQTQSFQKTHCISTNKIITIQDVLFCDLCHMYKIKDQKQNDCCYICWNKMQLLS